MHAEVLKPAEILQASQDSKGVAKIGVQNENPFPQRPVTAVVHAPADQFRTKIPRTFINKKILTVEKPVKEKMDEDTPGLLVTETQDTENQEKTFAPTPSVETPVAKAAPPIEDLAGHEPVPGEKQEKIVFAEPAQERSTNAKSGGSVEEPPVKAEESKPVRIEEPKLIKIEEPEPAKIEEPKPVRIEEPKPTKIKVEEPMPVRPEILAEPEARPPEGRKSEALYAGPLSYKTPGLAELGIAAVRKFSREDDKKITFGERRKAVSFGGQEFRYAAYMEGVRLKLERIGAFNYPVAAAMNNLSGTLSVKISIRSDGSLENFSIVRPSVHEVLNTGAEKIVRMSSPFSPLPENIKRDADILDITINWSFSGSRQSLN